MRRDRFIDLIFEGINLVSSGECLRAGANIFFLFQCLFFGNARQTSPKNRSHLHFMFCLHEQTSKLSVHIWQITRQLWVWLHVPNSHRTKTLGNFRIEFRNLFGRMCGSRIKKTCLSRKKKKKKPTIFLRMI